MKPPRFPTVFECVVNAIACQQVTLTLGIRLLRPGRDTAPRSPEGGDARSTPFPARGPGGAEAG